MFCMFLLSNSYVLIALLLYVKLQGITNLISKEEGQWLRVALKEMSEECNELYSQIDESLKNISSYLDSCAKD